MKNYRPYLLFFLLWIMPLHSHAKIHLKVGYLPILDHLTLVVSYVKDHECFQQIEIEPKLFKTWNEVAGALEMGVIEAALILSPLAIDLFQRKVDIKTILLAHRDGSAITIKKNSMITTPHDLKGKTIAIPHQMSTHTALLDHYLRQSQLSLAAVTTKVIAPSDMITAMRLNKIDAFIVAEPFGSKAQNEGIGQILTLTKDIMPHHVECIIVVKRNILEENDGAIQEWVNSLVRAGQWIDQDSLHNDSRQVAHLTATKYFPHSEEVIVGGLQNPTDRISFSNLNPNPNDFKAIVDISVTAGMMTPILLDSFIDTHFYDNAMTEIKQVK